MIAYDQPADYIVIFARFCEWLLVTHKSPNYGLELFDKLTSDQHVVHNRCIVKRLLIAFELSKEIMDLLR